MKNVKNAIKIILSLVIVLCILAGLQRLVMPKYASDILEGNFTAEYYKETTNHDVILIGDCEVYENIDPIYLWSNYGITSYIRGNAQQLAWQSYFMLEDTLRTEKPKVVIYNVQALTYAEPQREEYNRMALDGMRWSSTKAKAIQASRCEGEKFLDYVFPLLRYHSRITQLTSDDINYFWNPRRITHNGYYMRTDVLPVSESDVADPSWLLGDDEEEEEIVDPWADIDVEEEDEAPAVADSPQGKPFESLPMEYLDKMRTLCEENDIQLILMKAPSLAPEWYDSDNQQVVEYADKYKLSYINFYELLEETEIDYETDTYDGGLHMNLSGADKLSKYLGKYLIEHCDVKDHRGELEYDKVYQEKQQFYEQTKKQQKKELDQYGEIRNY
ncbi:MAG: SGNH/GDSL hydrolase family protein [Eubacterium sp.]